MPKLRFCLAVCLAIAATASSSPCAATAPSSADEDTLRHEVPAVTVKAARPLTTPGSASAIDMPLDSTLVRPAATLEDVLRKMPLVIVRRNSRGEAQPALRGGEDRQIAVLVDGVPITLAWDQRSDLSIVPVTAARRVTLHRGLSSLLQGPNALAGALEVDLARGSTADVRPPALVVDAGVDQTGAGSVGVLGGLWRAGSSGRWIGRAGVGYRRSDGFALPHALSDPDAANAARLTSDGDRRLNTDVDFVDGFLSLRRATASGLWASLTGMGSSLERGVAPEAHTTEPRLWRYPELGRGLGAVALGTGMRGTPWGRGDLELGLGAEFGHTLIDEYSDLSYQAVTGSEQGDDRTLTARMLGDHTLGTSGDLRLAATYADIRHLESIDGAPQSRYRQRLWSAASEVDWRPGSGTPVRLSAGVAVDGADTPETADKPPLGRLTDWAARLGATVVLREGSLLVHGSAGRRARFPGLRELYSGALGRFLENPDLRPEILACGELGATWRARRSELQIVGFGQTLDDAITRISVATPGGSKFQRVNLGRVTAYGIELIGTYAVEKLETGASLTLQHARGEDAAGQSTQLEYEPAISSNVWAEVPVPGRVRLAAELTQVGEQSYIDLDSGEFATLAPSARVDLRIARGFELGGAGRWRQVEAMLAIENVADQPIYDQAGLPQPGRTIRLQFRLR